VALSLEHMIMALHNDDPFAASPPLPHERLKAAVTARRVRYLTLGYEPIPVLSGRKRPAIDGWQDVELNINTISAWANNRPGELSTGIRTRHTPGFDIDILDPNVADQVQQALLNMIPQQGTILKRVGLPPKRLIPFRCATPFKKISATFKTPDDVIHKVEVLADGQQFVAEGIHETTQQPYRWADNVSLINVAHEHLPLVDEALAQRFIAEASEIMRRAGWVQVDAQGKPKKNNKVNGKARPETNTKATDNIYYRCALKDECAALAAMPKDSGRNNALNTAAFNLFQLVAGGGLDENLVRERLFAAAEQCGLVAEDGAASVLATIESGAKAGRAQPRQVPDYDGDQIGVSLDDFHAYMPMHSYIFVPTRQMWAASSVNSRIGPQELVDANGNPILDDKGEPKIISASAWLDRNHPVEQMTWSPGMPMIIENKLISEGGRNKFGAHFISDFYADWVQHGAAAIEKLRLESPKDYVKVAASLLPRELHVKAASIVDGWTEDEVKAALDHIRSQIAGAGLAAAAAETASTAKSDSVH